MSHILGRLVVGNTIVGYVVQRGEGQITAVETDTIMSNRQEFNNVELVKLADNKIILKEKGISDKLTNYWRLKGEFTGFPVRHSGLNKATTDGNWGSVIILSRHQLGYTIMGLDGIILKVSEQAFLNNIDNTPIYNAMVRGNSIVMKANYDIPDFRLKEPTCSAQDIIVIDTETTGVNKYRQDEVLQLSIIDGTGKTLWNKYYKPATITDWAEAAAVNHITPEMVANCNTVQQDMPQINAILSRAKLIVGYNTVFDTDLILKPAGAKWSCPTIDVMRAFAPIYGELSPYGTYKWRNLGLCANYFKYNWGSDNAHDGAADCRATLHCYKSILKLR